MPVSLSLNMQLILTVICVSAYLLGTAWFHSALKLIKVNILEEEERKLVTHGPFSYVRHPLYSTLLLTVPPLFIIWFSDLLFLVSWGLILILAHYVVIFEERELITTFGDDYRKYQKYVPPLIPYKGAGGKQYRKHGK